MRIFIIGAGAMGGLYGGMMVEGGADVTLIDVRADHVAEINATGLAVSGLTGSRKIAIAASSDVMQVNWCLNPGS